MAFVYKVKQGDTLNKIAQQYGFTNYKQAGVSSVPSGNFDLIRPGEEITLGNYDPNKVSGIQTGSPVVSSQDDAQGFRENSNELDRVLGSLGGQEEETTTTDKGKFDVNKEGQVENPNDPVLGKLNAWESAQKAQFEKEAQQRQKEYDKLYKTQLASIDATANATTQRITASYEKRLDEQRRINDLNIARVKAYGLGSGGQYTPVSFGDAITNREKEASDRITSLESDRNSLIAQAEQARLLGKSSLLAEKMTAVFDINKQLRESLEKVEREAEAQYKLLRDLREEEETKHKENVDKMIERLSAIAPKYIDEYEDMDDTEKDAFIEKLATQTGVDYATVYGIMQGSVADSAESALKTKKAEADILASQALAGQRNASASASYALANQRNNTSETAMDKDVPDTFKDEADFKKKRQGFIKEYGTKGADYWDAIFFDDQLEEYSFETGGGSVKDRAEGAGYDYEALKAKYTDEEIEEALNDAGV